MSALAAEPASANLPDEATLILGCIDIGSNTTRLLVAEVNEGRLRELVTQRAFTRIGKSLAKGGEIPRRKVAETADVVATQASIAREVGAQEVVTVATAAITKRLPFVGSPASIARWTITAPSWFASVIAASSKQ